MKEVLINDLSLEDLMSLINQGERFYVRTSKSDLLPEHNPTDRRDAFWFEEAPVAEQPIRKASYK